MVDTTGNWTNEAAIGQWESLPAQTIEDTAVDGDLPKRHLVNPHVLRLLGELNGKRVLDAGCGNGYLSRILAGQGARVVGVEPTQAMYGYAAKRETEQPQGIDYVQADLTRLPDLGEPFDAVVCSMVLMSIPDWKPAMRACVEALRPGGLFVLGIVHPAFEELYPRWREHGEYRQDRYLAEYELPARYASDFHRPISSYVNELLNLGCRLREFTEPGLPPHAAEGDEALHAYVRMPNFLILTADAPTT